MGLTQENPLCGGFGNGPEDSGALAKRPYVGCGINGGLCFKGLHRFPYARLEVRDELRRSCNIFFFIKIF